MGILNSFGALVGGIVAAIVMLTFAILSFFLTVFIVDVGADLAGFSPDGGVVVIAAAILTGSAIIAGATPMASLSGME